MAATSAATRLSDIGIPPFYEFVSYIFRKISAETNRSQRDARVTWPSINASNARIWLKRLIFCNKISARARLIGIRLELERTRHLRIALRIFHMNLNKSAK